MGPHQAVTRRTCTWNLQQPLSDIGLDRLVGWKREVGPDSLIVFVSDALTAEFSCMVLPS